MFDPTEKLRLGRLPVYLQVLALLQQSNQAIAGLDATQAAGFATRALSLARLLGAAAHAQRGTILARRVAEHMARHTADYEMLAVLAPMTLQTAAASGDVLGAVDQLEGLILGGDGDDEDNDDGDDDDDDA
jgi:hypothetical protein